MPASDIHQRRRVRRTLAIVFWSGAGLMPVAAILILVSDSSLVLRVAAVIAVFAIVLIGASITLRHENETSGAEVEDMVLDEIEALHADVREDIANANRVTQKALGDRVLGLQDTVDALRDEVETLRAQLDRGITAAPAHARAVGAVSPQAAPGVVRHTETVKVTTRSTFVDPNESGRGTVYGANGRAPAEPQVPQPRRGERPHIAAQPAATGDSWTEQMLRQRMAEQSAPTGRRHDSDDADRITGVLASDRWASVRSDENGRELRMGERRAALREDESGTEMRIEDRWAAVLRDEGRGEEPLWREEPRRAEHDSARGWQESARDAVDEDSGTYWSDARWGQQRADESDRWTESHNGRRAPAALPAAPVNHPPVWSTQPRDEWVDSRVAEPISAEFPSRRGRGGDDDGYRRDRHEEPPRAWSARPREEYDFRDGDRWR